MGTQQVLIVDDRPTNQNIFARLTSALDPDIVVKTCGDPREALTLIEGWTPDLIIVDFSMPEMNGAEFTRAVRRRPATHEVPIVVITAYDDRDFRLLALEAGATDFLQSPVDRREFQSRARTLLAFRRQQLSAQVRAAEYETDAALGNALSTLFGDGAALMGQVLDAVPVMVAATDRDGRCLFVNAHQAAISGRAPAALVGSDIAATYPADRAERDRAANARVLEGGSAIPGYEEEIERDGVRLIYLVHKAPLRDGQGEVTGVLTSAIDITGRKRAETHLNHMARHDALTGLPNRILFRDRLQSAVAKAQADGNRVAVYLLDLDRFKFVNDTRGHRAGDLLLEKVAATVGRMLKPGECAARLGGDEFAVLIGGLDTPDEAAQRAEALLAAIDRTYSLEGHDVVLSASLGIALSPDHATAPDELLRTADLAMYAAKAAGGNTFRFFHHEMNWAAQTAVALEADLHAAIDRQEFELFYQPVSAARTGAIVSAEALLRWNHPVKGRLGPGDFLRCAEETGMIIPIGGWVLREACRQLAAWRARGVPIPRVSVNLSALQFQRTDVFALVRQAVSDSGLEPDCLELEIVESLLVANRQAAAETLQRLRDFGVRVAVDDFGTGYSSLQYLRDLPVDRLKIDRSFVSALPYAAKDAAIVHAITSMAHDLGLETTAEGVETEEQQVMLRAIGCDHLQGYHIGRPQSALGLEALLASRPVAHRRAS
ncbi:EAL domain-containing response regulator [Sphingomonas jatrophae]|uniref:PAS domain S-box-containing protein/diguanylate cyclase (GGDEF) domain-containing protein n=1 Tax=Sphingomonas jatrophae TaxID=1166337 RepID=A0A1I6LKR6_9SPHN|nr:EAL domain-containing protein [Sphingomonas jatrophae]SFS04056.1 PAS domain S-box-containing protein/diguanylate cyclase (GGDEF) domain-containing protein [Sphingomonas jatrophae]